MFLNNIRLFCLPCPRPVPDRVPGPARWRSIITTKCLVFVAGFARWGYPISRHTPAMGNRQTRSKCERVNGIESRKSRVRVQDGTESGASKSI